MKQNGTALVTRREKKTIPNTCLNTPTTKNPRDYMHMYGFQTHRIQIYAKLRIAHIMLIFLASSGSFTVKNDNIHNFFRLVANFEFAGFAPKQKYTGWTVSMEMVRTAKS